MHAANSTAAAPLDPIRFRQSAATLTMFAAVDPSCQRPIATSCRVSSLGWEWSGPFVGLSNPRLAN